MRYPARLLVMGSLLLFAATAPATGVIPLRTALEQLQRDGHPVVYSTDLVRPEMLLGADTVDLETVEAALATYGLALDRSGALWLVVPLPPSPPPVLEIVSQGGTTIQRPVLVMSDTSHALLANAEGRYPIDAPAGTLVTITAPGHEPLEVRLTGADQTVILEPAAPVETVIVTGSRHRLPAPGVTPSTHLLTANEMRLVPALGGDSMRVANRLPGMSSVGVSAKPRIRGGLQNETLILVDGIELIEAFHLADFQSVFSSIDDRTVDSIDVYTGGFPARYGNRMSGVMDVTTALGPSSTPGSEVGLSLYNAFANTRGVTEDGRTQWLGSIRRGNLDLLIDRINSRRGSPKYLDGYLRVGHRLGESSEVFLGAFNSTDDVDLSDGDETASSHIDSNYVWVGLDTRLGTGLDNSTTLSYVEFARKKGQQSPPNDEDVRGFLRDHQNTDKIALHTDFGFDWHEQRVEFGAQAEYARANYDTEALIERGDLALVLGSEPIEAFDIHVAPDGWSGGLYLSADLALSERLSIQPGVRWDVQDYYLEGGSNDQFSPRLGVRYAVSDDLVTRFDVGRFYQPEPIQSLQTTDGVSTFQRPQRADHYIGGLYWTPAENWSLRAEAYLKRYHHTALRFENIFDPFVILPELEADRVAIAPQHAEVWGVDLEARRRFSPSLSGTLRYSYMDADDTIEGASVARRWSQRHTVNAILTYERDSYTLSAAVTWNTGWRTSVPPEAVPVGTVLPIQSLLNNTELREYYAVDLSASKTWTLGRSTVTVFADLSNTLDRNNIAGIDYDVEQADGEFVFTPDTETLLPLIPSLGIVVAF